jgi:hypothetical protein
MNTVKQDQIPFSNEFNQMASYAAVAKTVNRSETLHSLVKQCFAIFPDENVHDESDICDLIETLSISVNKNEIKNTINDLLDNGQLEQQLDRTIRLSDNAKSEINNTIQKCRELESQVKENWLKQTRLNGIQLDYNKLWNCLLKYLAQSFRRHGMQTVELLNPSNRLSRECSLSLSSILDSVVSENFDPSERGGAHDAIASFFLTFSTDVTRSEYVSNLANGAFNFFSLTVPPEVSESFRTNLKPLTIFLDTNYIFGLLGLNDNPQMYVSSEIIDAIRKYNLPFKLKYHLVTQRELSRTLFYYQKELRSTNWGRNISKAIIESNAPISGIEKQYHQKNAETRINVDDFFSPFRQLPLLIENMGITLYNVDPDENDLRARADLEAEYRDFINIVNKDKSEAAIEHDINLLYSVRRQRTSSRSIIEAGTLLMTYDYTLFRFDIENSRNNMKPSSVVLPSYLWQVLRPFATDSAEYNIAFSEVFALPEFSFGLNRIKNATARMASILASYKNIPEDTAKQLLANDLLLNELQKSLDNETEFNRLVESAIAQQNEILSEEKAALATQLEKERIRLSDISSALEKNKLDASRNITKIEQDSKSRENEVRERLKKVEEEKNQAISEVESTKEQLDQMTVNITKLQTLLSKRENDTNLAIGIGVAVIVCILYEIFTRVLFTCDRLHNLPNAKGLEGCILLLLFTLSSALIKKSLRKSFWSSAVILGILLAIFSMVGE